jgi:RNA methyltransferase, TrmH family
VVEVVYGLRAALALFEARRGDIERVAYARGAQKDAEPLLRWAKEKRIPAREGTDEDLARLARSHNHEGIVLEARGRKFIAPADLIELLVRRKGVAIALDRVRNPYNVGAILRSAAFFGVDAAILGAPAPHPALAPDAVRVAEGGAEHLALARTTDLADALSRLHTRGISIVGADSHAKHDARSFTFARPVVLVVGHEREGLGERIRTKCDALVSIRGTDAVESLNVAVASGILMSLAVAPPSEGR